MQQKFLDLPQGKLSYYEQNDNANNTIIFIHGNSGSARMWHFQFTSQLRESYRLIAVDLPGHGSSFHSKYPLIEFSPLATAQIISDAIKTLVSYGQIILVGFSYGSNLVGEMIRSSLSPVGIVLVGASIFGEKHSMGKVFIQHDPPSIFFYNEKNQERISDWFERELHSKASEDIQHLVQDYLVVDKEFKPSLFKTAAEGQVSDEVASLAQLNIPVCVVFGANDSLINISYLDDHPFPIWNNSIYKLPNAGHWVSIDRSEEFNAILIKYAEEMFKLNRT